MASSRQLKGKIRTVGNIKQITKAMQMGWSELLHSNGRFSEPSVVSEKNRTGNICHYAN